MQPLNEELRIGQQRLKDLGVTKAALGGKLRIHNRNAQKAADIRKQLAGKLWPRASKVLSKV